MDHLRHNPTSWDVDTSFCGPSSYYSLDLFNTWNLSGEEQNKHDEYWMRFEEHVKPHSNHILNRYYLWNLKQNGRPLDNFLTAAKLLIQNRGYLSKLHDE